VTSSLPPVPTEPPASRPDHPAFRASCALGILGIVLLFVGAVTGIHGLLYAGVGAGAASLLAALAWRADLVASWRQEHPRGRS
jgi:hypothetical protein